MKTSRVSHQVPRKAAAIPAQLLHNTTSSLDLSSARYGFDLMKRKIKIKRNRTIVRHALLGMNPTDQVLLAVHCFKD